MRPILTLLLLVWVTNAAHAQDAKPLPPIKPIARVLPPVGISIPKEDRDKLEARLATLTAAIQAAKLDAAMQPDVEIYTKAVRWALDFDEFYDAKKDIAKAHASLDSAQKRLDELAAGKATWPTQRGLLARGYRSDIDDSVQPYGLHIPANLDLSKPVPLLVWLHGRGDKETDLHFIASREKSKGEFAPDWCITLHPYGRGTIGFKFAGEIDVLDAIESVKKRYKIDDDRIALAGFSMGGAGAWHIGAHYADRFCVVHAGAGFVETAKYQRLTPEQYPEWYVQKLWGWYDVPDYTRNLFNVPVIAYSGEIDKQKQAADLMAEAFKAEGRELRHIIGPGAAHKYEAKAKEQVLKEIKAAVDKGRDSSPKEVHLQTRTLRYYGMHWVYILNVEEQWKDTRVDARYEDGTFQFETKNVIAFAIHPPRKLIGNRKSTRIVIDGQQGLEIDLEALDGADLFFSFKDQKWIRTEGWRGDLESKSLAAHGPIDDVFLSPFLVVEPTGVSKNPRVQRWVEFELAHFKERWRALCRGDLRVKKDTEVQDADFLKYKFVLWGDPDSNGWMGEKHTDGWPISWDHDQIQVGDQAVESKANVLVMVYGTHWVLEKDGKPWLQQMTFVLNSGPTFREGHDHTNSQQTPKLPDWAIIGLDKDPDAFAPGEIKAAGFFDENWKVKKQENEQKREPKGK